MNLKTDIEIAQSISPHPIKEIAKGLGLNENEIILYGDTKAKIRKVPEKEKAKLVLVTAINPTPAGEGKTTTTIGLADSLNKLGEEAIVVLREPSLGPVFGVKGGATGGGYAQVIPMEEINLHFTGDFHAIGAANNLLAAMLDNHIYQGNELGIDKEKILVRRAVDMNDRQLRNIIDGRGKTTDGVEREDGFDITVASEVMAVFCLAKDLEDLKKRLGEITVAYTVDDKPVTAKDLKANGAMAALLKDAFYPNLVQTLEGNPAIIHGGPFANIAHGCNSVAATKLALGLTDGIVVTEAGFGADLGAEKFFDIKCRPANLKPDAVVLVATVRALKYNGGVKKEDLSEENLEALKKGLPNLLKHVENIKNVFGLPLVVAINRFPTDTEEEISLIEEALKELGVKVVLSEVWEKGSQGGIELAEEVQRLVNQESNFRYAYQLEDSVEEKVEKVAKEVYGAKEVEFSEKAQEKLKRLKTLGYEHLPVCIAKTQYSLSDDPTLLGRPEDFTLHVRDISLSSGAGFIVVMTGEILKMPGLPKKPAAEQIDITKEGKIIGIF